MTLAEFILKHDITMKLVRVPYKPGDKTINYEVTLSCGKRSMTTPFGTGIGWLETAERYSQKESEPVYGVAHLELSTGKIIPNVYGRRLTVHEVEEATKKYRVRHPKLEDVLYSLRSDAESMINSDYVFKVWCLELGFNDDSIKDKASFDQCIEEVANLKHLLGLEAFGELVSGNVEGL